MRSADEFNAAKRLIDAGVNDSAIARQLGIPRPTVRDWRCRPQRRPRLDGNTPCGCRVVANDRGVRSVRYHFSNRSDDIIGLFTAALDVLGFPWTRSTKYIVSIYRKVATARLDTFIGPKDRAVPLNDVHYAA